MWVWLFNATICRTGMSITEWLRRSIDFWPLVMPCESAEKLCKEKYECTAVAKAVGEVCDSGPLGLKLFGFALKQVLAEQLASIIEQEVAKLVGAEQVGTVEVVNCKQTCWPKIEGMKNITSIPGRREVVIAYRGQKAKAKVTCIGDEIELRIAAAVRGEAIESGRLAALSVESELLGQSGGESSILVKDAVIQESAAARSLCNNLINSTADVDSEGILAVGCAWM